MEIVPQLLHKYINTNQELIHISIPIMQFSFYNNLRLGTKRSLYYYGQTISTIGSIVYMIRVHQ